MNNEIVEMKTDTFILILCGTQVEKLESDCNRLQQELQDSKDQNELLEFRILELEVHHKGFSTK